MNEEPSDNYEWRWSFHWFGWSDVIWFQFTITLNPFAFLVTLFGLSACFARHQKKSYSFLEECKNRSAQRKES